MTQVGGRRPHRVAESDLAAKSELVAAGHVFQTGDARRVGVVRGGVVMVNLQDRIAVGVESGQQQIQPAVIAEIGPGDRAGAARRPCSAARQ